MKFSIKRGDGRALCARCQYGTVIERERGGVVSLCNVSAYNVRVPDDVVKCTSFEESTTTSKYDMEKIAWQIRTDNSGKILGFRPPKKTVDD